ncbi:hypothetical protein EXU48_08715 [Occultella glacieicola]|uniref:Uncharacterized protein n=1 Tax=Occultella glacieicola TaxID=2518684 RepID=A0ABY2E4B6_9MICO|nr:hypothetical protein [Occultella glacieicola]TDE94862.1 hypothetical protein EXU48_08715 [Occultella glacieicola]
MAAGRAGEADERLEVTVVVGVISIVAVLIAAVPLLLLDPVAHDGAAPIGAIFGIPMVASALIIEVVMRAHQRNRPLSRGMLWWVLGVLPVSIVLCSIPAVLDDPEYFAYETGWGAVGTLAGMLLLAYLGILMGGLLWFFVVFPLAQLVLALIARARGDKEGGRIGFGSFLLLGLAALILILAGSLDGLAPGRSSGGQIIAAVLGIPGSYEVVWPLGLWIVRLLLAGFVLLLCWPAITRRVRGRRVA